MSESQRPGRDLVGFRFRVVMALLAAPSLTLAAGETQQASVQDDLADGAKSWEPSSGAHPRQGAHEILKLVRGPALEGRSTQADLRATALLL